MDQSVRPTINAHHPIAGKEAAFGRGHAFTGVDQGPPLPYFRSQLTRNWSCPLVASIAIL
jgi:hypothetical protein